MRIPRLTTRGVMILVAIAGLFAWRWEQSRRAARAGPLKTPHDYLAAERADLAMRMLESDPSWIHKRDRLQQTPLHVAAYHGHRDVAEWLLRHGADVNATAYNDFTPLHLARTPEMVRLLLRCKAEVNGRDVSRAPLRDAAGSYARLSRLPDARRDADQYLAITRILRDAGAEYDITSAVSLDDLDRVRELIGDWSKSRDKAPVRAAAGDGRARIVELFLAHDADPEDAGYHGLTLSYFAVEHPDVLKLLFNAGADPNVVVQYDGSGIGPEGSTLLHEAAKRGATESAELLVSRGVKIDVTNRWGHTPLYDACAEGRVETVRWLLENKADPRGPRRDAWGPMAAAAAGVTADPGVVGRSARYQAIIRMLEHAGAEIDLFAAIACDDVAAAARILKDSPQVATNPGWPGPALHRAVELNRITIVKLLLDAGCDPNIRDEKRFPSFENRTALHAAASWGRVELAKLLIRRGADVNAKGRQGATPLHDAAWMNQVDVIRALVRLGADVNARDDKGETPLDLALRGYDTEQAAKLLRILGARGKRLFP